jgi:hypothetical protein
LSLSLRIPHQNLLYNSHLSIYAKCPAHLILLDLLEVLGAVNIISFLVEITKLI